MLSWVKQEKNFMTLKLEVKPAFKVNRFNFKYYFSAKHVICAKMHCFKIHLGGVQMHKMYKI